jgi:transcriptional regulator with XRE-family HTH domain
VARCFRRGRGRDFLAWPLFLFPKTIREHLGLKQKEFAETLGIAGGYISEIEAGKKNPGIDVLEKLHRLHNVNISYLFTGEGDLFIQPGEEKKKEPAPPAAKEPSDEMTMARKLIWHVMNIPVVRYAMLEAFSTHMYEKGDMVEKYVEAFLNANKGEKRP